MPKWKQRRWARQALGAILLAAFWPARPCGAADPGELIVVFASGMPAYTEALEGLRQSLGQGTAQPLFLNLAAAGAAGELAAALGRPSARLVIAIGTEAQLAVFSLRTEVPVLSTMILRSDAVRWPVREPLSQRAAAVYLDLPVTGLLTEIKNLLPGKTRLGVIRNPSQTGQASPSLEARARQLGFTPVVVDCSRPEDLAKAFLSLKSRADLVLLFPDSALYNNATVKPLILASLESRLPIIGFSANFVRAGAAAGVYPDFRDVGRQVAELALRYLSGRAPLSDETPRKLVVAVNQRITRVLGLEHAPSRSADLVVFR